ncbi:unnamed protein product [Rotaria socialis]|uniref:Uncharacterized protein n=3 Tax=Rotaria socialis TaxID=392032 RepID=A0A821J9E4_9BILA|nr:unnamed protein product [Rotaria socialis]CAF4714871.1 unnamed protein product [Rotaria socialis]
MAYFDLETNPATSIKSKSSDGTKSIDVSNFRPVNKKPIGNDWDVKPGDILSWSDYRSSNTYFVTGQHRLRKNRDTSGSGYLTIPLSITRLFPSALTHYGPLLEAEPDLVAIIELSPTDGIFAERFGSPLPETICNRNDIQFLVNPMEDMFYVSINGEDSDGFPIDGTKAEEIIAYIGIANEKKAAFLVKYEIKEPEKISRWPQAAPSGLPIGWTRKSYGFTVGGADYISGTWKFEGPETKKDEAYKIVEKYYDGFDVQINWETDSS